MPQAGPDTQNHAAAARHPVKASLSPALRQMGPQTQSLGSLCECAHSKTGRRCFQNECRSDLDLSGTTWCLDFTATFQRLKACPGNCLFLQKGVAWGKTLDPPLQRSCGCRGGRAGCPVPLSRKPEPSRREGGCGPGLRAGKCLGRSRGWLLLSSPVGAEAEAFPRAQAACACRGLAVQFSPATLCFGSKNEAPGPRWPPSGGGDAFSVPRSVRRMRETNPTTGTAARTWTSACACPPRRFG